MDGIPWRQFKPEFLKEYRGRTLEIYESTFRLFENLSTPTVVSAYTYNHAKEFKASLRAYVSPATKRPLKDNSVNIHLRNMHSAFNEAVRLKYVLKNPFADVRPIPVTKRVPRYLSIEQVRHLLAVAKKSTHPDIYPMLMFFLYTGMRLQELTNLKWTAFDLDRGVMYLHGSEGWEPKDREEHAIGLHGGIAKLLKRRESREGYVFTGKAGKRRDARATGRLFNVLYKRAGITASGCHILRHSFATHFQGREKALQRVLGHSDPRTTQRYSHVTPEELDAVKDLEY